MDEKVKNQLELMNTQSQSDINMGLPNETYSWMRCAISFSLWHAGHLREQKLAAVIPHDIH